jgi:recyclin-1
MQLKLEYGCRATTRMRSYKPAEHAETSDVAPLVQFFELVHLGDTVQSMVQVYFDKTLVSCSSSLWLRF